MSLSLTDQGELLTALHAAEGARPLALFLDRFRRRVGARDAMIVEQRRDGAWTVDRLAPDSVMPADPARLLAMRTGRAQDFEVAGGPVTGRAIRSRTDHGDQWLVALDSAGGFDATDSALMTNLSPHVAIACANRARIARAELRHAAAEAALRRAGVAWSLLDDDGRPVAGHALAQRTRAALADAQGRVTLADDAIAVPAPDIPGILALTRAAQSPIDRARIFAAEHGTSASEARLAIALAEGASIAGAAAALGLTIETARHYSKRLYAITGANGQADLVRLVWTGLAALG